MYFCFLGFRCDFGLFWGDLGVLWCYLGFWDLLGFGGLVWWDLGGVLGYFGSILGSENGSKWGFGLG